MNSNGALVKEKISDLRHLDMLTLSLEGPEEIHDAIRGHGSFSEVREALRVAREHGIKAGLATVLTAANIDAIDYLLDTARQEGCRIMFQPATSLRLGGRAQNDLTPLNRPFYAQGIIL